MMNYDPNVFSPDAVTAETASFNEQLEKRLSALPPRPTLTMQQVREIYAVQLSAYQIALKSDKKAQKIDKNARHQVVPGPASDIPVHIYTPETVNGVYLHIHGGGFNRHSYGHQSGALIARQCNVAVVQLEYRLAPENPYPAAPDDCEAVAVWLVKNARREFGLERLIIGGESAGATLSVVTLVRMRDRHGFTGFSGANLSQGTFDVSMTPSARNFGKRALILNTPTHNWAMSLYTQPEKMRDPDVSPLYADLSNMPPALFTVGTLDPLLDDTLFMHARWVAAGNRAELAVYPGGCHGFNGAAYGYSLPKIKIARQADSKIIRFIKKTLE